MNIDGGTPVNVKKIGLELGGKSGHCGLVRALNN